MGMPRPPNAALHLSAGEWDAVVVGKLGTNAGSRASVREVCCAPSSTSSAAEEGSQIDLGR